MKVIQRFHRGYINNINCQISDNFICISFIFFQMKDIAGYAVGEYVGRIVHSDDTKEKEIPADTGASSKVTTKSVPNYYEIVTAWVNPK